MFHVTRVIAVNSMGESVPSERGLTGCDTPPAPPDNHPHNVETDRSKPGYLIIRWDVSTDTYPRIYLYNLDNFMALQLFSFSFVYSKII